MEDPLSSKHCRQNQFSSSKCGLLLWTRLARTLIILLRSPALLNPSADFFLPIWIPPLLNLITDFLPIKAGSCFSQSYCLSFASQCGFLLSTDSFSPSVSVLPAQSDKRLNNCPMNDGGNAKEKLEPIGVYMIWTSKRVFLLATSWK